MQPQEEAPICPGSAPRAQGCRDQPWGCLSPTALVRRGQDPFAGVSRASPWLVHSQTWG